MKNKFTFQGFFQSRIIWLNSDIFLFSMIFLKIETKNMPTFYLKMYTSK